MNLKFFLKIIDIIRLITSSNVYSINIIIIYYDNKIIHFHWFNLVWNMFIKNSSIFLTLKKKSSFAKALDKSNLTFFDMKLIKLTENIIFYNIEMEILGKYYWI